MRKVGELVLIYYMGKPSVYARIEAIEPDVKNGWYRVKLLILSIPAQIVEWILKEEYIDGTTFTMGGIPLRLSNVEIGSPLPPFTQKMTQKEKEKKNKNSTKVIDLHRHKKNI